MPGIWHLYSPVCYLALVLRSALLCLALVLPGVHLALVQYSLCPTWHLLGTCTPRCPTLPLYVLPGDLPGIFTPRGPTLPLYSPVSYLAFVLPGAYLALVLPGDLPGT